MKVLFSRVIVYALAIISFTGSVYAQKFRHVPSAKNNDNPELIATPSLKADTAPAAPRELEEIINSIPSSTPYLSSYTTLILPRVFYGFKNYSQPSFQLPEVVYKAEKIPNDGSVTTEVDSTFVDPEMEGITVEELYPGLFGDVIPSWLSGNIRARNFMNGVIYSEMIENPEYIQYLYWKLPEPVKLQEDDPSYIAFLRSQNIPVPERVEKIPVSEVEKHHWLHVYNSGIQFSQAYISPNWYQGGNNHLALLINLLWDVQLNQVYHPNLLFQNTVSYKLGLNSQTQDKYHKYAISEDLFQWNLKFGVKAFKKWFYTFTLQFKTQFLNNYPQNSLVRSAGFLSPGDLNLGIGMTYSTTNKKNTLKFNASISPISYNLKTCIDPKVDPVQFNIAPGRKFLNEIGSMGELTLSWKISSNINYSSRLFLFSNYKYFQGDWENTLSFAINRFLSTQIYVHARYDTSSDLSNQKWKHFMLKEILSFGFSYNFSTK